MDPKSPERDQPKPEIVQLNQEFQVFPPGATEIRSGGKIPQFRRTIGLRSLFLPVLYFGINAANLEVLHKEEIVTPFYPDEGYQITWADSSVEGRKSKRPITGTAKLSTLSLTAGCDFDQTHDLGILEPATYWQDPTTLKEHVTSERFKPETQEVVGRLHLHLSFPTSSFEAEPDTGDGAIWFGSFYPIDTGPLPSDNVELFDSFILNVPPDFEKLQTITGNFVLVPPQTHVKR